MEESLEPSLPKAPGFKFDGDLLDLELLFFKGSLILHPDFPEKLPGVGARVGEKKRNPDA